VRYSDHQEGRGPDFFRHACRYRLEGTIAKRRDRPYRPGRSGDWRKIKCDRRDEFVVIGFTEPGGVRHGFGALLLGYYDPRGALHYAGRVGTGFNDAQLGDLRARLDAIARTDPPTIPPKGVSTKGVHWSEPRLVAEVRYADRTTDGMLRHPAFQGLREDKSAAEVVYDRMTGDDPHPPAADTAGPSLSRNAGEGLRRARLQLVPECGEGVGGVDIDEDSVRIHLDFIDEVGVLADQVLGADVARKFGHFGKKPAGPQDRVAAFSPAGRHDDRAPFQWIERGDQPVEVAPGNQRHVAEADDDPIGIGRQRRYPPFQ
jgi:hypothetical protein